MSPHSKTRKAPLLDPKQALEDAKTIAGMAAVASLSADMAGDRGLKVSEKLARLPDLYSRLASYAEEYARLRED